MKTQSIHWRLNEMSSGTHAVVRSVEGSDAAIERLMAMGLCTGREVEIVRQGNPLILRLLGARIGVSERIARQVVMEQCRCAECDSEAKEGR
ncbi:MAG: ferrous iron transport protein A [Verrucomicrobiae bacterium]|nr:ferrous iron transport protein A [Verrucomicrobiae bacterium]